MPGLDVPPDIDGDGPGLGQRPDLGVPEQYPDLRPLVPEPREPPASRPVRPKGEPRAGAVGVLLVGLPGLTDEPGHRGGVQIQSSLPWHTRLPSERMLYPVAHPWLNPGIDRACGIPGRAAGRVTERPSRSPENGAFA